MFDLIQAVAVVGVFFCVLLSVGTQTLLQFYEAHCRNQWMLKSLDMQLIEKADSHIYALQDEWQKGLENQ